MMKMLKGADGEGREERDDDDDTNVVRL